MGAGYAVVIAAAAMTHRLPWPGYEQARLARATLPLFAHLHWTCSKIHTVVAAIEPVQNLMDISADIHLNVERGK
jgi:hypothetical protein